LLFIIIIIPPTANPELQESSIIVEITPSIVESNQTFSVSVFDPNIQIGTPYLVNVTILFNNQYYQITPFLENGALLLTAPEVHTNKTYLIQAFTSTKTGNSTIQVIPQQNKQFTELVIITNSFIINSYEEFTILVTDKSGQPIPNVIVTIQQSSGKKVTAITDINGRTRLTAPNKETITIIAEKQGYNMAARTLQIITQDDTLTSILSNPNLPIIASVIILLIVIIFISYKNKNNQKLFRLHVKNFNKHTIPHQSTSQVLIHSIKPTPNIKSSNKLNPKIQIEKIPVRNISSHQKINNHNVSLNKPKHYHQWFKSNKQQDNNSDTTSQINRNAERLKEPDEIHKKIDAIISKKENKTKNIHSMFHIQ
jgi:hypothetical protein